MIRIIHDQLQHRTSESFAQVPETAKPAERAMADRKGHVVSFICHIFGCMLESEWLSTIGLGQSLLLSKHPVVLSDIWMCKWYVDPLSR
jgi:hypothetical protein